MTRATTNRVDNEAVNPDPSMQMKRLTRWERLSFTGIILTINMAAAAAPASEGSLSIVNEKGENVKIERASVRLTPIYKESLFAELKSREASNLSAKLQFDECKKSINEFYCWKMYGDEVSAKKLKVPDSMLKIAFDPLYIVLTYKPLIIDLNNQKKIGEDALIVCLNPSVPSGYWKVINQYKPILKSAPSTGANSQPLDKLKLKACSQYARFKKKVQQD